jgi:divalent metal cation (Fe/Co/Zn/Cd) transporter
VGARATQELVSQEADEPNKFAVPTALASWGLQYVVHKKLHPHRQRSGAHADAAQHAHIDAITAPIILTGVLAAELGYTHADPAAALVAGVFVARSNIEILRSLRKNGAD